MVLLIDNYDSFSYNLFQLIGTYTPDIKIIRNDAMSADDVIYLSPDAIIISPGPGKPEDAGICVELIKKIGGKIPLLGVCLGHQAICTAFGAVVSYAACLMHGKQSETELDTDEPIFNGCNKTTSVARYHSLSVIENTLPDCLRVTAKASDGEVMAVSHTEYKIFGLQFHPESIMTPDGGKMIENFLKLSSCIQ